MPTDIRPVDPRDTSQMDALTHLFAGYAAHYKTAHPEDSVRRFFSSLLLAGECVTFLAYQGDDAAGFVNLYPKYASTSLSRYWILNDLFVDEDHRRTGVAHALMQRAEDHARATGARVIVLKTHVTNTAAQALYASRNWHAGDEFLTYTKSFSS